MPHNVGFLDGFLRVLVGGLLLTFAAVAEGVSYRWVGLIGIVPVLTTMLGWCPAYSILGIKTCPASEK
ncbi:DUF2892 domain-containing protein [Magnetospira sp. QH-2]|uniref:YgaP family membrane protein n=1 Tax=Magnetospira sp. (strain QH-2) TaxID=1288970 RepID=UPI0003E81796|nr:DUF2892 domain-containing protein [Magnetospira sp. QH-2]CCQ72444.1 Conserved membrane protein of unknown function [Magnetospira sp. QH-2]